ncbi:putative DNA-directed RNA polymerase I subunit RPA2 [Smittium culicis]|uniref:DNA-directed RNA polymerase subunit beta n=1 Tax=Smittium culicis TaxID=133412 RepID=A0A1R1YC70_9FUNG|nr:putative DNA-directed RNA polymerase I subunit RPA2 [Smittium culicis]
METKYRTLERQQRAINPTNEFEYPDLQKLGAPHINSFNRIFESAGPNFPPLIDLALKDIGKITLFDHNENFVGNPLGNKLTYWIEDVQLHRPTCVSSDGSKNDYALYPAECRERKSTYRGKLTCKLLWQINDGEICVETKSLGYAPIMVKSNRCNLEGMGPKDMIKHHEDAEDFGGYFVVNGGEKIIRLLIAPKRNHVTAVTRRSYSARGPGFTEFAVQVNCSRLDQSSVTATIHYLNTGNLLFRFTWFKQEFLVPISLILKALCNSSDKEIFENLVQCDIGDTFLKDQIELLLLSTKSYNVYTKDQALAYLGSKFRVTMSLPEDMDDIEVGQTLIDKVVMVHLENWKDKYNMMIFAIRKLYSLVSGKCQVDNSDSLQHHEVYMPGFMYLNILKEKIFDVLAYAKTLVSASFRKDPSSVRFNDPNYIIKLFKKVPMDVGLKLQYFLATGNLVSKTGMNLQQTTGFTIVAEKLNFLRYISHFQCIHRGSFFAELKTTSVRKLLPEGWGFLCPVHTPDGSPCGLLNHLAHKCEITTHLENTKDVEKCLLDLGVSFGLPNPKLFASSISKKAMVSNSTVINYNDPEFDYVTVQLDGKIVGFCTSSQAADIAKKLRIFKTQSLKPREPNSKYYIPQNLEIGLVPKMNNGQFPGLYIFSTPNRFVRPVQHLATKKIDYVGPFEQVYMEIACMNDDIRPGQTEYREIQPTHILSSVANLTPFCDFNQSPRNMYQCQMGKQSMGTPSQALRHRADNKLYWLQSGQTPVVRPALYDNFGIDGYPNGMNAVVAVLAYTGYDMEDAMILNKSGLERGFGYGSIYKTEVIDLNEYRTKREPITHHFMIGSDITEAKVLNNIDADGLPFIGTPLVNGDPVVAIFNDVKNTTTIKKYKGEPCYVDTVRLINSDKNNLTGDPELQMVQITYRIPRAPVIGDKFSSRHGQKGVNSIRFPAVDLPFTESGMQPDVIINPHAFPSRMTIGMFVESLAGKTGALYGVPQDATPFQFNEENTAADFFGEQLIASGYNYHGNEPMYSGVTGEEMMADIYIGVVYYQRLRHMVNDKYQVRTLGPIDPLTHQPIKGRKKGGGIRLGEMERDSLLAHGTSYILQDRLLNCSDYSRAYVCKTCGSILAPIAIPTTNIVNLDLNENEQKMFVHKTRDIIDFVNTKSFITDKVERINFENTQSAHANAAAAAIKSATSNKFRSHSRLDLICRVCQDPDITLIAIPYVLRYLATELACMNIKINLTVN